MKGNKMIEYRDYLKVAEEKIIEKYKQEIEEMALVMLVKKYKNKLPLQEVYFDKTERNLVLEEMYRLGKDIFFLDPLFYYSCVISVNSKIKVYPFKDHKIDNIIDIVLKFLIKLKWNKISQNIKYN